MARVDADCTSPDSGLLATARRSILLLMEESMICYGAYLIGNLGCSDARMLSQGGGIRSLLYMNWILKNGSYYRQSIAIGR